MSHFKERKEKDCLNCNAVVNGRYCHLCGQENIVPKESFWHLLTHFIYDITHFDSKFFSTVKYLLIRPAFLSREYMRGRRNSYLNPIKMYVFISAFFSLFFFSVFSPSLDEGKSSRLEIASVTDLKKSIDRELKQMEGEVREKEYSPAQQEVIGEYIQLLKKDLATLKSDTTHISQLNYSKIKDRIVNRSGLTGAQYDDSIQSRLKDYERDPWLIRLVERKVAYLMGKYGNQDVFFKSLFEKFRHSFPQLLFVSLPLFALLLKLLYVRKKPLLYADHVIYSVHLYCAMFILMFIFITFSHYDNHCYLSWLRYLTLPIVIYIIWYQYKSLRNFYEQGRLKTVLKYFLLLFMSSILMTMLFLIFLVLSVFNM